MKLRGINKALTDGCKIHAFRSGGGLRVVRIENAGDLKGYGEHPQVEDALSHADEDYLAGGRPYDEVYGEHGGSKPHYMTGSSQSTSELDHWLMQGHTFDVWYEDCKVVFQLKGLMQVETPADILKDVETTGNPATWMHRGYTYQITRSKFPNGETCTSSKVVKSPEGKKSGSDCWMYTATKTGRGLNFWDAMSNAFFNAEVEVTQK